MTHEHLSKLFSLNEVGQRCILGWTLHCGQHCYLELMVKVAMRYHSNLCPAWFKFTTACVVIRPEIGFTHWCWRNLTVLTRPSPLLAYPCLLLSVLLQLLTIRVMTSVQLWETPMYHPTRRESCQHNNVEQTLSIWKNSGEASWATGGQWDVVKGLHNTTCCPGSVEDSGFGRNWNPVWGTSSSLLVMGVVDGCNVSFGLLA